VKERSTAELPVKAGYYKRAAREKGGEIYRIV
jgi:hypothetical protein